MIVALRSDEGGPFPVAIQIVWWATAVEAVSSLRWLWREWALTASGRDPALARLAYLRRRMKSGGA